MGQIQEILRYNLFTLAGTSVNVATLGFAIVIALIGIFSARMAERAVVRFLRVRGIKNEGSIGASARLTHYFVLVLGLAIAVHTLGVNLTTLFAAGAFLAIALGFAMQNITENFVSGVILLLERTIKPEDVIEVEGRVVKVTKLGMRATVVRTWDSEDFIIPNSVLVSSTVKNFTLNDTLYRVRAEVGVTYDSDMQLTRSVLEKTAVGLPGRVQFKDPVVLMKGFGSSSVDWNVSVWVDDPFARAAGLSKLYEALWFALKDAGITIAFPQLDVHLDTPALQAIDNAARR